MVKGITSFDLQQIAMLSNLPAKAVQAISFNNSTDFYENFFRIKT